MQAELIKNFEAKNLTSFKVGGKIENAYFPQTQDEFIELMKNLKNFLVLGNCSNVLISSSGFDGNIIFTTKIKDYTINGTRITASCGVKGQLLSKEACEASLSGFEFMTCFPGSVGGEIYMNASAHGQAISDTFTKGYFFDKSTNEIVCKEKNELGFRYRFSVLQQSDLILISAEFELQKAPKEQIEALMRRNLASRKSVQPSLANPNAGSVFKNPENDSAGRLLDKSGVKEFNFDTVKVWDNHANFIINKGNANSTEILELMLKMKERVKSEYTIELLPEIIYIGNKNKKEEEICKKLYQKVQK